ncbi:unnamed protein product [Closterium sp. NIES-64]|nr:unnamed protein product [Closterium sp. NIES-64]
MQDREGMGGDGLLSFKKRGVWGREEGGGGGGGGGGRGGGRRGVGGVRGAWGDNFSFAASVSAPAFRTNPSNVNSILDH